LERLAAEEELRKKEEEEARRKIRVTIDLAGRKIVSTDSLAVSEERKPQVFLQRNNIFSTFLKDVLKTVTSGAKKVHISNPFLESPAPKYIPQTSNPPPSK
jgi:hypothetical protein